MRRPGLQPVEALERNLPANLFLVGLFHEPPAASLVASAVIAVIGLSIVLVARLAGRAVRHG